MYNLYNQIANNPARCRRFTCGESLFTIFNCRLKNKYEALWSHHNYVIYVAEGRKIWHTPHGSYDLRAGDSVFVRKGAAVVEQFFDTEFCFFLVFLPDEFICDVLREKAEPLRRSDETYEPIISLESNAPLQMYFQSMMAYVDNSREPDQRLLELKFKELVLTIADNPANSELRAFFSSLLQAPQSVSLARVMENNFCFNLKMEEFAKLSSRSLSAFKGDFQKQFNTTPAKWLKEKRIQYAAHLLTNLGRTVTEAAFESGFEDPSHFSRCFREHFGLLPIAFKQKMVA
jgi:AraC-like DNA-binding protein